MPCSAKRSLPNTIARMSAKVRQTVQCGHAFVFRGGVVQLVEHEPSKLRIRVRASALSPIYKGAVQ